VGWGASELLQGAEIRHLAALVAVAEEPSLATAARKLGCAQSTLRQQLTELEREAGTRLFERRIGAATAALTDAGRSVLERAQAVVACVNAARADLEALDRDETLRVAVPESISSRVAHAVLGARPDLSIVPTRTTDDFEAIEHLIAGRVDVTLVTLPPPSSVLASVTLLSEPYVLLVPARSGLGDWATTPPPDTVPLIACRRSDRPARVEEALAAAGWRFQVVRYASSDAAVHAFVAADAGVAILPRWSVDVRDAATRVVQLGDAVPPMHGDACVGSL
jgi:DNA-binding transcriptional LysR family regulator